jgi:hypothetical protein
MSLLDDCSTYNFEDMNNISSNIDKDLEEIDNLINELDINNSILIYKNITHMNAFFLLVFIVLNDQSNKQLVPYNHYGFDCGYNLYKLYMIIIDINVRFIINYYVNN